MIAGVHILRTALGNRPQWQGGPGEKGEGESAHTRLWNIDGRRSVKVLAFLINRDVISATESGINDAQRGLRSETVCPV